MANLQGFDARTVEPMDTFEPIPAGKYIAAITASEMKPTWAGDGSYLQLEFEVLEGDYKGRKLWVRLDLDNPNELVVKLARAKLAAICKAVGVLTPKDSVELHYLPMQITVSLRWCPDLTRWVNGIVAFAKKPVEVGS